MAPSVDLGQARDSGAGGEDAPGRIARDADPVVMLGAALPGLAGVGAEDVVGFARRSGGWVQIPIQVDERAIVDFCEIYGKSSGRWTDSPACKTNRVITTSFYTDEDTFTGPDPTPEFDDDDELVFMARDAGDRIGEWTDPEGVVKGSGVEVELVDGEAAAYVYLFERDGEALDPGAGARYVEYDFVLEGGLDYLTQYELYGYNCGGDEPRCDPAVTEDSIVRGANYSHHFAARWVSDALRITEGGATGVDILDVHQARFGPDTCGRHVLTFSTAEGAFVANISGPVRAVRSYLGANSGPLTQRIHHFYDRREDITTHLRVHALRTGIMDVFDYSEAAIGMTYSNELEPDGVTIDGVADDVAQDGLPSWELIQGEQGSLVMTTTLDVSFGTEIARSYWLDDSTMPSKQCDTSNTLDVPDAKALGTSGYWFEGALPDTDPKNGSTEHFVAQRVLYFGEPELSREDAIALTEGARAPVRASSRVVGFDAWCGDGVCGDGEDGACLVDCAPEFGSCGDGLCMAPENSVSCLEDCPAAGNPVDGCGDGTCDASVENELSCSADCWLPFDTIASCLDASCGGILDACADESDCVDVITCVGPCARSGSSISECLDGCVERVSPSRDNADAARGLLMCGGAAGCF